jgi:hypothetical protein
MKPSAIGVFAAGATALAFSHASIAGDWKVRVGPVVEKFDYREKIPEAFRQFVSTRTTEDGPLYGVSLRIERRIGRFEVEGALSHVRNEIDFNGAIQEIPSGREIGTDPKGSDARITDASIRVARWFLASNDRLALYGGVGYRRWDRDVENGKAFGSSLDYTWPYVMLGAKVSLHKTERLGVMIDVRVTKPIDPKVRIAYNTLTEFQTVDPGSEVGFRIEAPVSYRVTATGGIEVAPFYERHRLTKSKTEQARLFAPILDNQGNVLARESLPVTEPGSASEAFGLNIHWFQEF